MCCRPNTKQATYHLKYRQSLCMLLCKGNGGDSEEPTGNLPARMQCLLERLTIESVEAESRPHNAHWYGYEA